MKRLSNMKVPISLRYILALTIIVLASPVVVHGVASVTTISNSTLLPILITLLTIAYAWCIWTIRMSPLTGMSPEDEMAFQVNAYNEHSLVTMADRDNRITYVNDNFLQTTGFLKQDLLGELTTVFYPKEKIALNDEVNQTILAGEKWVGETPIMGKNGQELWTHLTIIPNIDKRGRIVGSIAIRTDITQNKIDSAEKDLRRALHVLSDEIYMFETDTLRYTYLNQAAMTRCGWDETTYKQKTIFDREIKLENKNTYDIEAFYERVSPLINGEAQKVENKLNFDGLTHEVSTQLLQPEAGKPYFLAIVRDISERCAFEQIKDNFISTVSHELRTPVTSIKGSLGLVLSGVTGELNDKTKGMLDIAYGNSDRLILLINDILDLEKIAVGLMEFDCKPEDMAALISDTISANESYASRLDVSLVGIGFNQTIEAFCDSDRVFQIMNNLLSNAAKFSDPGGEVIVRLTQSDKKVCISVEDFGAGIPEEAQASIFDRFTQVNSPDRRVKNGTGLGLSIVKALVENQGGTIELESQLGKGTKFSFEIPKPNKTQMDVQTSGFQVAAQ